MVPRLILFVVIFFGLERFCRSQTSGFQPRKIVSDYDFGFSAKPPPDDMAAVLAQPLRFLGSGVQFYAFESFDSRYVVKFVKHHRRRPDEWQSRIQLFGPLETWRQRSVQAKTRRIYSLLGSCRIAAAMLPEETGIVYAHLNKTEWNPTVQLIDRIGIVHEVGLGNTEFVIQKKAVPCTAYLKTDPAAAISQIAALFRARARLGIVQHDDHLERNLGFIEGRAVDIDIGSFQIGGVSLETSLFRKWLEKEYPDWVEAFDVATHS